MASKTVTRKIKANENNIMANKRNEVKIDIKRGNNKVVPEEEKNKNSNTEGSQTNCNYATKYK